MTIPIFALGVTGHRPHKLNPERLDVIAADIRRVMMHVQARLAPRRFICVSSLAEGADTMAAEAALALGWELFAPLPFPAGHYARDFAKGPPTDTLRRLMLAARTMNCTPNRLDLADDTEGYIAASGEMLARSDAVIAIWDGEPTALKAGAYDTMMLALFRRLPVLWIDARGERSALAVTAEDIPALASGERPAAGGEDSFLAVLS
ncbi:hypothetical protein sos41_04520 [Alphaproteobacteria bacterium SO-S41]|nr:hypothetical protein sos41_04520 [Alphaproteobacteria bacterium SO-S41]